MGRIWGRVYFNQGGTECLQFWKRDEWDILGKASGLCGCRDLREGGEMSLEKQVGSECAVNGFACCTVGSGFYSANVVRDGTITYFCQVRDGLFE